MNEKKQKKTYAPVRSVRVSQEEMEQLKIIFGKKSTLRKALLYLLDEVLSENLSEVDQIGSSDKSLQEFIKDVEINL
jgi:hypothetical protein